MLDLTKPVQTRSGLPVRIFATDVKDYNNKTIVGAILENGYEYVINWDNTGKYLTNISHKLDLVNVKTKYKKFMNIYRAKQTRRLCHGGLYGTACEALKSVREIPPNWEVVSTAIVEYEM